MKKYIAPKGTKIRIERWDGKVVETVSKQALEVSADEEGEEFYFMAVDCMIYVSKEDVVMEDIDQDYFEESHTTSDKTDKLKNIIVQNNFENVSVEEDTTILASLEAKLDEYDVLYQKWYWGGIYAESFIFLAQDVSDLNDEEVEILARTSPLIRSDSEITMSRKESGYVFVNFNFEHSEDTSDDWLTWEDNRTDEERKRDRENGIRNIGLRNSEVVAKCKKLRNIIS